MHTAVAAPHVHLALIPTQNDRDAGILGSVVVLQRSPCRNFSEPCEFLPFFSQVEAVLDDPDNCELTTQSPDLDFLLSTLRISARCDLLSLTEAISYTLDAFTGKGCRHRAMPAFVP